MSAVSVQASNFENFRFYGSFLYNPETPNVLYYLTEIKTGDDLQLRKAMRDHQIDLIALDSPGGSVREALRISGIISDNNIDTYVPEIGLSGAGICASACSFAFLSGKNRVADGLLGVHQFYSADRDNAQANVGAIEQISQETTAEIIAFLNDAKTPPFVYVKMFQQREMYYFNDTEMNQIERGSASISTELKQKINATINSLKIALRSQDQSGPSQVPAQKKRQPSQNPLSEKEIVKNVQRELNRLNCNAGGADGVIGGMTKGALDRFNKKTGNRMGYSVLSEPEFLDYLRTLSPIPNCYQVPNLYPAYTNTQCQIEYGKKSCFSGGRTKVVQIGAGKYRVDTFSDGKLTNEGYAEIVGPNSIVFRETVHFNGRSAYSVTRGWLSEDGKTISIKIDPNEYVTVARALGFDVEYGSIKDVIVTMRAVN